jgi:hypothetical protein
MAGSMGATAVEAMGTYKTWPGRMIELFPIQLALWISSTGMPYNALSLKSESDWLTV